MSLPWLAGVGEEANDAKRYRRMTEVHSIEDFLQFLRTDATPSADRWFRGHASEGWGLSASIFRTPSLAQNEVVLLKRFIQEARRHIDALPDRIWDWVFLAQHHHVPTRLLDWSESPLIGIYFAAQDHLDIDGDPASARDGRVWVLKPSVMNSALDFGYSGRDLPMFDLSDELDDYRPLDGTVDERPPVAALAARSFQRISAQWGTFTVCNVDRPLEMIPNNDKFLDSVVVPVSAKSQLREQLSQIGMEDHTIYPDLFRLGQRLAEVYS